MAIDWDDLWKRVLVDFEGDPDSIHGPSHWQRVERFGLGLAAETGADVEVVRLFAILHDSRRVNDGCDEGHGARAAEYAATLRRRFFELSDERFDLLREACRDHASGARSPDPTIGTCWDADRLDLGRVGVAPSASYMSTESGRRQTDDYAALRKSSNRSARKSRSG